MMYFYVLVQECRNSIANTQELSQSCANLLICISEQAGVNIGSVSLISK